MKKTKARPKKTLKQLPEDRKKRALVFTAVFAVVGGFIIVATSFASTVPSSAKGSVRHLNQSSGGVTNSRTVTITSNVHKLCVATTFDTFNHPFNISYHWVLTRVYKGKSYELPLSSPKFGGNGNRDHYCFQNSKQIVKGGVYYVKFVGARDYPFWDVHGSYSIWGYSHN